MPFRVTSAPPALLAFAALALLVGVGAFLVWTPQVPVAARAEPANPPFSDYRTQAPGVRHEITVSDLPEPDRSASARNDPDLIDRPADAWPQAPEGFEVHVYATELENPRLVRMAPNGDLFVAESDPGRIRILRGVSGDGGAERVETFAEGLNKPFGIAFYPPGPDPQYVYVGETDAAIRFPYRNGDLRARGPSEQLVELPGGGLLHGGGHWTRDIAFSPDGREMFLAVGSYSNVEDTDDNPNERHRANILVTTPEGGPLEVYADGVRNPVGIAVHPETGELWASVNERDGLGDNLPPDYITHIERGGFYGWPWYYIGGHQDPRHAGKHPELKDDVITPDVLIQPHNASLQMTFYTADRFPAEYRGDIFAAQHGSWNRSVRTGYEVIRVLLEDGRATGAYEDFLTGFVTPDGEVWGRPVGVAVDSDGALIVTDDGSNTVWRVHNTPEQPQTSGTE